MSLWHPNDLVSDEDLIGYVPTVLTQFGRSDWQALRQKALDDWLMPYLEGRGYPVDRFKTRAACDAVFSFSSPTYTDQTAAAAQVDGLNLATLLSTSAKYLYLGAKTPFRGVSIRITDAPSTGAVTLTTEVWADTYVTAQVTDGTLVGSKPLAKGGSITWPPIDGVVRRVVNSSAPMYWARLSCSGAPTGCTAGSVAVIRKSRLVAPATMRTLHLLFMNAPSGQDGPWERLADYWGAEAEKAWLRVAEHIGPEFDTDNDDVIDGAENTQTAASVATPWTLERM